MIDQENRFFAPSGNILVDGPSTWHIIDWDQRRLISVTVEGETESEDSCVEELSKYVDGLASDVYAIARQPNGEIIISNDPKDDNTLCVYYPPLSLVEAPAHVQVLKRDELKEIDRISAQVDMVVCPRSLGTGEEGEQHAITDGSNQHLF